MKNLTIKNIGAIKEASMELRRWKLLSLRLKILSWASNEDVALLDSYLFL